MFDVEAKAREDEPHERGALPGRAEVLIRLEADFHEDGTFGHRILEVTAETVRVLEASGALSFQMPIAEIASARNEPLVGGGRLEITARNGEVIPIVSYS